MSEIEHNRSIPSMAAWLSGTVLAMLMCLAGTAFAAGAILFEDRFDGDLSKWMQDSHSAAVFTITNHELIQKNTAPYVRAHMLYASEGFSWKDYTLSFKARHVSGFYSVTSFNIYFRMQRQLTSLVSESHFGYMAQLHGDGSVNLYVIDLEGNTRKIKTSSERISTPNYSGYSVKISAVQNSIKVYVDGRLMIDAIDSTYSEGTIGLATVHFVGAYDDVVVIDESSSATTCDTATSYNQGYAAGEMATKAACQANPVSCGITTAAPTTSSHATYDPLTAVVRIPYLDVPNIFGPPLVYSVDLNVINTNPLQFQLKSVTSAQ